MTSKIFYNLHDIVTPDGYIFIKIIKAMYGLKQAAVLAYQHIKRALEPHGYYPVVGTTEMWRHKTCNIAFCLCVDDFGIKYFSKFNALHLLQHLGTKYDYTTDLSGTNFCGLKYN